MWKTSVSCAAHTARYWASGLKHTWFTGPIREQGSKWPWGVPPGRLKLKSSLYISGSLISQAFPVSSLWLCTICIHLYTVNDQQLDSRRPGKKVAKESGFAEWGYILQSSVLCCLCCWIDCCCLLCCFCYLLFITLFLLIDCCCLLHCFVYCLLLLLFTFRVFLLQVPKQHWISWGRAKESGGEGGGRSGEGQCTHSFSVTSEGKLLQEEVRLKIGWEATRH